MTSNSGDANHSTGRRQFLKSLFGLGVVETKKAYASAPVAGSFIWADLKTGQVGFPTGTSVGSGLPGSLMKLVAAAAIRQENLLPGNATFECRGSIILHKHAYSCQVAHGKLELAQAIGLSCNVFFAQAAEVISPMLFLSYASKLGLNHPVAGYQTGLFPETAHGDPQHYVLGLAEDLKPNALQILQLAAMIATNGNPPVLHSAEDTDANYPSLKLELSIATWQMLHEGMKLAGRIGTAKELDPENKLHLAVKTGTAPHGISFQSWITGYFPVDAPRHAFCARAQAGTSQSAAVPLARRYLFSTEWP
jgi:cell division protein FtsI/penicillin-binding protein 2